MFYCHTPRCYASSDCPHISCIFYLVPVQFKTGCNAKGFQNKKATDNTDLNDLKSAQGHSY